MSQIKGHDGVLDDATRVITLAELQTAEGEPFSPPRHIVLRAADKRLVLLKFHIGSEQCAEVLGEVDLPDAMKLSRAVLGAAESGAMPEVLVQLALALIGGHALKERRKQGVDDAVPEGQAVEGVAA